MSKDWSGITIEKIWVDEIGRYVKPIFVRPPRPPGSSPTRIYPDPILEPELTDDDEMA